MGDRGLVENLRNYDRGTFFKEILYHHVLDGTQYNSVRESISLVTESKVMQKSQTLSVKLF